MFLNRHSFIQHGITKTLRFKLAAGLSLFLILILAISIAIISILQWRLFSADINNRLKFFIEEFESEYLTGEELKSTCHMLDLDDVPNEAFDLLKSQANDDEFYFFALNDPPVYLLFTVSPSGSCNEYEIDIEKQTVSVRNIDNVDRVKMLNESFNSESYGEYHEDIIFTLFSKNRELLTRSTFSDSWLKPLHALKMPGEAPESLRFDDIVNGKTHMRVVSKRLVDGNILVIGYTKEKVLSLLSAVLINSLWTSCAAFLITVFAGWVFAGRFSRGIEHVALAAREIEEGDYSIRIENTDEFIELHNLVCAFNSMTNRTERLLSDLSTVADNIAHDLRTPLTRLSGKAELALYTDQYRDLPGDVQEECTSMIGMINTMLEITQTENRVKTEERTQFNFSNLLRRIHELFSTAAEDRDISLNLNLKNDPIMFRGCQEKFSRVFANLLDNALKFTPSGGTITMEAESSQDKIILRVSDTGCGISPSDIDRIFDRFFRSDSSRSLSGNGLGLSLVKAIVEAAGGTIAVSSKLGHGTTFVITLIPHA